ncbi:MAG: FIST C-terminal domain-containing protein [Spirochaetia bacterium]|jgi:hypothetical protein|nr:FIST C-terminal domain-containing protein [Spirochaetia bacterium]
MIKTFNACTEEIDDIGDAIKEITGQIEKMQLAENSVGILSCHYEFIENGTVAKLCDSVPFDIIGMTTIASASGGAFGMYQMHLTVLTSSEVSFSTAATEALTEENFHDAISDAYKSAAGGSDDTSLIISFFPYTRHLSSADTLRTFDNVCGGIPIWGSVASDVTVTFQNCNTILNGRAGNDFVVMLLFHGPANPEFLITSIPSHNISPRKALITESDGCILKKANDMTLADYFNSIQFHFQNAASIPLILEYEGSSVALAIYSMNKDGSAVCGGETPVGAFFSLGEIDEEGIIETAEATIDKVLESGRTSLLMLPCVTRYIVLHPNSEAEIKKVIEKVGGKIPYWLAYSGGEICPVRGGDGKLHNRLHNYTFSACVL